MSSPREISPVMWLCLYLGYPPPSMKVNGGSRDEVSLQQHPRWSLTSSFLVCSALLRALCDGRWLGGCPETWRFRCFCSEEPHRDEAGGFFPYGGRKGAHGFPYYLWFTLEFVTICSYYLSLYLSVCIYVGDYISRSHLFLKWHPPKHGSRSFSCWDNSHPPVWRKNWS